MKNDHINSCTKCDFDSFSKDHLDNHVKTVHKEKVRVNEHSIEIPFCHYWNNRGYCRNGENCKFLHKNSPYCELKDKCNKYLCPDYHEDFSRMNPFIKL